MADNQTKQIRIVSAIPLSEQAGSKIAAHFAEKLNYESYELKIDLDPTLIGGLIVYAGDLRYDHSVQGQLNRIAGHLKRRQSAGFSFSEEELQTENGFRDQVNAILAEFDEQPIVAGLADLNTLDQKLSVNDTDRRVDGKETVSSYRLSLDDFMSTSAIDEVGQVVSIGDGIAMVTGMRNCMSNELVLLGERAFGLAMNLEDERIGVVMLQNDDSVRQGTLCKRTGRSIQVPAGRGMLGRVVDALAQPIDGLGPVSSSRRQDLETPAPAIIDRKPITRSLHTGITAIDAMTPIGHGQRELIIGDRQTGKTALAIDSIINQRGKNVYCIYVAIGQKMSTIASVVNTLQRHDAMAFTTVVAASASDSAALQFIAPYTGCALAEGLMHEHQADVLVVYDDLTKHAQAYRSISLLLRRPPGREAFPGDIFYLHARLLERAGQLNDQLGGGSITALPIVETQNGDISAYIPTNVISITDGQIYLESDLFFSGQRPAINVGLSVSRVGGAAQTKAMKKVAGPLRIKLAQYRELEAFAQFGSELDKDTQKQLKTGMALLEVLKQPQYHPVTLQKQVLMLYIANQGVLTEIDREDIDPFLDQFSNYLINRYPTMMAEISEKGLFTDEVALTIDESFKTYWPRWLAEQEDYEAESF